MKEIHKIFRLRENEKLYTKKLKEFCKYPWALGWDRLKLFPTAGIWMLPPSRVWGGTFGKYQ